MKDGAMELMETPLQKDTSLKQVKQVEVKCHNMMLSINSRIDENATSAVFFLVKKVFSFSWLCNY